ncbi:MAG: SCO family protein [Proteobacteria bacterium]|nr:MAG: SCO family protein [Pseudomonadota bacterium]
MKSLKSISLLALLIAASPLAKANDQNLASASIVSDIQVTDQDGKARAFFKDVVEDSPAVINFLYTNCGGICPTLGRRFVSLQKALGKTDVKLISITIDPEHDDAKALKDWGKDIGAKPGWTFVTGKREDLNLISERVYGAPLIDKEMHSPMLVLRSKGGAWIRMDGLSSPTAVMAKLRAKKIP